MTKLRGKIALILCFALSILMIFMLTSCDTDEKKPTPSQGLELELNTGTDTYTVVGIGTCTDTLIVIPSMHKGKAVTSIESKAFYNCTSLTSVTIPDSVTSIGGYAFNGCYSLTSVTIPDSVKRMGSRAFNGCHSLTIYCEAKSKPSGWDSYWNDSNRPVVWDCKANGTTEEGLCWAQKSNDEIIIAGYTGTNPSVEIPSTINSLPVTSIGEGAFARCTSLTSATIPDSVTSIGYRAFYNCISLTSIEIPNSVTSIGEDAFALCASLTSVTIPDSVKTIGDRAFYYCTSLTSIEIPNSVTSIGNSVFDYCRLLTIYCEAERRPSGWDSSWNYSSRPVVWGHTHTYANGKCVCGAKQN